MRNGSGRVPPGGLLLGAYVALLPVQLPLGAEMQLAPSDAFVVLYVLVRGARIRHVPAAWSLWHVALVGILALGLLVALVRTTVLTQYAVVQKGLGLLVLLVTYACVVDFARDWSRLRWLLRAFLGGLVVNAAASVAAFGLAVVGGPVLPLLNQPFPSSRLAGTLLDANAYGGLIAVGLLLHVLTARSGQPLLRGGWARTADVVLPLALLLTFSRSAWLGAFAGLSVALLLWPRATLRAMRPFVVPTLVLGPVVVGLLAAAVPTFLALVTRPSQVESRLSIVGEAWDGFVAHPVVGTGLGTFTQEHGVIVHNTTFWFLTEMGLVGLGVVAGLVISYVIRLMDAGSAAPTEQRPLVAALLVCHLTMVGVSMGIEALYQRPWWLVMAAAGSAFALTRRSAPEPRPGPVAAVGTREARR